ncbi:MAG: 16S rRNA (guanine(966)-N(2))-methyltransferase RsmD [Eubacteriales bacterium]|nr:16S rRNA (guanine(966)-N(2))-methyltransferase RsmD [Eubacteriales bacterium]
MRVITGAARGRRLREPVGSDIRPTTDQVKEALFNIIQFDIEGRRVLDLFAGTGQLGIEALSRGAAECVFVDADRTAQALIRENLAISKLQGGRIVAGDSLDYLRRGGRFDLIFIDPPYHSDLAGKALESIKAFDILSEGGIIVCETGQEQTLPEIYENPRSYRYGKIVLTVFRRTNS